MIFERKHCFVSWFELKGRPQLVQGATENLLLHVFVVRLDIRSDFWSWKINFQSNPEKSRQMICCNILYIIPSVTANDKGHGYAGICSIVRKYSLFSWFRSEMEATTVSRGYTEEILQSACFIKFLFTIGFVGSPTLLSRRKGSYPFPCERGHTPSHMGRGHAWCSS